MEGAGVELEPDDSEDEDGEGDEEPDLHEGGQGLEDRLEDDLEACREGWGLEYIFLVTTYTYGVDFRFIVLIVHGIEVLYLTL